MSEFNPSVITTATMSATARDVLYATSVIVAREASAPDGQERHVRTLEGVVKALTGRVFQVNYYIPELLNSKIPNPARIFQRHGYSLDGSNKLLTEGGLDHPDLRELFAFWTAFNKSQLESAPPLPEGASPLSHAGPPLVEFWVVEYTAEQLAAMRETCRNQLARRIREVHTSLIERIDHAAEALKKAQDALDAQGPLGPLGVPLPPEEVADDPELVAARAKARSRVENNYNGALRDGLRDAIERFESCLKGAELFDDTGRLDHLFGALRDAIRSQVMAANATLAAKGRKQVEIPPSISGGAADA